MKNIIKKLFSAVLTLTITAALCPMTLYADEAAVAQMEFESVKISSTEANNTIVKSKEGSKIVFKTYSYSSGTNNYGLTGGATMGRCALGAEGDAIVIELPQKDGYDLTAAEVTVAMNGSYVSLFDYSYSSAVEGEYTSLENAYISTAMDKPSANYNLYAEIVKVPVGAKYLKIARNANTTEKYSENAGVTGFIFGYAPQNVDKIQLTTTCCGNELMKLLASGMLPSSGELNIQATRSDRVSASIYDGAYGLTICGTTAQTFNAIGEYKITDVSMKYYAIGTSAVPFALKLGDAEDRVEKASSTTINDLNVTSEAGETSFTMASENGTGVAYDVVITMEKDITGGTVDVHGTIPKQNEEGVASSGNVNYSMVDYAKDNGDGTYTNYTADEQTELVNDIISTYTEETTGCTPRSDLENFSGLRNKNATAYAVFKAPQDAYIQNFDCYIRYISAQGINKRLQLSVAQTPDGPWINVDSTWEKVTTYEDSDGNYGGIYRQKTIDGVKLNAKYLKVSYPLIYSATSTRKQVVLGAFKYDWTVEKEANTYPQSGTWHIGSTENPYWLADTTEAAYKMLADYPHRNEGGLSSYMTTATNTVTEEDIAEGGYIGKAVNEGDAVFVGVGSSSSYNGFVTVQAPDDSIATKATFYLYRVGTIPDIAVWTSDAIDGEYTEVETTVENIGRVAGMSSNHYIYALTADNLKDARFIRVQLNYGSEVKLGAIDIDYTRVGMPCIFTSNKNDDSTYTLTATNYTVGDADCKLIVAQYDTDNKTNTLAGVEVLDKLNIAGRGSNVKTITPVSGADKISVMAIDAKTNKPLANPVVIYPVTE
ncbi:MAG: hypothetical protein IJC09_08270 [Clostridia bacterium]|nr:hypothetical protein [Clostridia bacterium]